MQEIYVIRDPEGNDLMETVSFHPVVAKRNFCLKHIKVKTDLGETVKVPVVDYEEFHKLGYTCHRLPVHNPETHKLVPRDEKPTRPHDPPIPPGPRPFA